MKQPVEHPVLAATGLDQEFLLAQPTQHRCERAFANGDMVNFQLCMPFVCHLTLDDKLLILVSVFGIPDSTILGSGCPRSAFKPASAGLLLLRKHFQPVPLSFLRIDLGLKHIKRWICPFGVEDIPRNGVGDQVC